jgi:endonuclease/exonuclease/phosphatase family metal-dependent hydrolase
MVTIATWNLENLFLPGGDGPKDQQSYEEKLASLAGTITAMAPDVLAVQEVGDPEALAGLAKEAGGDWHTVTSQHPDSRGIRVGFLSRLPFDVVGDTKTLPIGLSPVQVGDTPAKPSAELGRGALAIEVTPTPGVTITIITCHLKSKLLSFPGGRFSPRNEGERARFGAYALYRRAAEAVAVRELATGFLATGARVVVLGDLNDEVTAATTQILCGPTGSEVGTPGFEIGDGGDAQRLWNLAPCLPDDERFSRRFRGRGELIDHIFCSHALVHPLPRVRTKITHDLPSITDDPAARKGKPGSDHAPVVATFPL